MQFFAFLLFSKFRKYLLFRSPFSYHVALDRTMLPWAMIIKQRIVFKFIFLEVFNITLRRFDAWHIIFRISFSLFSINSSLRLLSLAFSLLYAIVICRDPVFNQHSTK